MTTPLRIVIPIHSFEPGGVERVALNLAQAWHHEGEAVTVVLGRRDGAMAEIAPGLAYAVRPSPVPTAAFETLWMIWCLWRYLRRNPADVLFCAGNTYGVVGAAMKLLLGRRCPPVAIKISNDLARADMPAPGRPFYRLWLRLQGRLFEHFVGMAGPMREEIAEAARIPPERVAIIHDPALTPDQLARLLAMPRSAQRPLPPHFLAIGRLAGQKNFPLLLRAFARGAPADARLEVLGDGPLRPRLERLAAQLGLAGRVHFAGHTADPAPALAAASALLLSSDYEGVPAVVLEALAAGLPVVATRCSVSMEEMLGQGRFGLLVPVRDEAALAVAIAKVCTISHELAAARAYAADFTIERSAPRYLSLFRQLAASRVQGAAQTG